ncbi:MAG: hypothetical protein RML94_06480 [Bacteroidia bacterium]|nr:hypothetical protein [Bacteroidia bacterium]
MFRFYFWACPSLSLGSACYGLTVLRPLGKSKRVGEVLRTKPNGLPFAYLTQKKSITFYT